MMKAKKGETSWKQLLEATLKVGKDKMLESLDAYHRTLEGVEAAMWAEPEMHGRARAMAQTLLKQDETLIRLRSMSEDDMRAALAAMPVGSKV